MFSSKREIFIEIWYIFWRACCSVSCVRLFVTAWTAAHQASLSCTTPQSLVKLTSIESVMLSNHLIFCRPLLLLPYVYDVACFAWFPKAEPVTVRVKEACVLAQYQKSYWRVCSMRWTATWCIDISMLWKMFKNSYFFIIVQVSLTLKLYFFYVTYPFLSS